MDYQIKQLYKGVQGNLWWHLFWNQFVYPKESLYQSLCFRPLCHNQNYNRLAYLKTEFTKRLTAIIQVNLCRLLPASPGLGTKLTWIIAIKICTINLPSQPFLGHQLGFHNFFILAIFEQGRSFFYSLAVLV